MELKDKRQGRPGARLHHDVNPFNGIERDIVLHMVFKVKRPYGIHSMELKAVCEDSSSKFTESAENPFNGIERSDITCLFRMSSTSSSESIQWN